MFSFSFCYLSFFFSRFSFSKKKKRVVLTFLSQLLSLIFFCVFGPCREVREERRWGLTLHAGSEKKRFPKQKDSQIKQVSGRFFLPFSVSRFLVRFSQLFYLCFGHFSFIFTFSPCFVLFCFGFLSYSFHWFIFLFHFPSKHSTPFFKCDNFYQPFIGHFFDCVTAAITGPQGSHDNRDHTDHRDLRDRRDHVDDRDHRDH